MALFADNGLPKDGRFFGISVREWQTNDPDFVRKIAEIADYAAEKYHLVPLLLPMRYPNDVAISEQIASQCRMAYVLKNPVGVKDMIGLVGCLEAVLGMRLHTLIYASGASVPVIGIVYDKKVSAFLDYIGEKRRVDTENIDVAAAKRDLDEIMEHPAEIRAFLAEQKARLAALAEQNASLAAELLKAYDAAHSEKKGN